MFHTGVTPNPLQNRDTVPIRPRECKRKQVFFRARHAARATAVLVNSDGIR